MAFLIHSAIPSILTSKFSFNMSQIWATDAIDIDIPERYPLTDYLRNAWLPSFRRHGRRCLMPINRANEWPKYLELQREPGTRSLVNVSQINHDELLLRADYFMRSIQDTYIVNEALVEEEESSRLRLPSRELIMYDDADIEFLSQINNEDHLLTLVQDYILGTISEVIRLMGGVALDDPAIPRLKFNLSSTLCPAHHARWDLFALPGNRPNCPISLVVVFVPPWEFGTDDFHDFTRPQNFSNGMLDRLDTKTYTTSDKLWAVVHDTCHGRGNHFVVTNYTRWAFGTLKPHDRVPNATVARITDSFEAPILEFDGTHATVPCIGFNTIEVLASWMELALMETRHGIH